MKIIFTLLLILFIAFSGYHLTFRKLKLPLFAHKLYLTGTEFLLFGLLLGPQFFNILDKNTCDGLEPLSALLLGGIGLLSGFQLELTSLKRFSPIFYIGAVTEAVITFTLVFTVTYIIIILSDSVSAPWQIAVALMFSATAACTAQTGISLFTPETVNAKQETIKVLRLFANIDGIVALILFSTVYIFRPAMSPSIFKPLGTYAGILTGIVACIGLLLLYVLLFSQRRDNSQVRLIVIGMIVYTSGVASILNFSPLLVNFFLGFCIVNFTREKERIYNILMAVEKPMYLLLLVFLGATLQLSSLWIAVLSIQYCFFRMLGKAIGGYICRFTNANLKSQPAVLGLGLLEQGGLPFAMLYDFQKGFPYSNTLFISSIVLLAIIYNDLLSPTFLERILNRKSDAAL